MKNLLLIFFLPILLFSCKKDDTTKKDNNTVTPPPVTTGVIRFTNNSTNPYAIYINNTLKETLPGKTFKEYTLNFGNYGAEVIQQSGYLVYPTDESFSFTLSTTNLSSEITFP